MSKNADDYTIRAVNRTCDILLTLIGSREGMTLTELSERADIPKSTLFRYVVVLTQRQFVDRSDGKQLRLGLAFLPIGSHVTDVLRDRVRPRLQQIRDEYEETVNLGMLDGRRVHYLDIQESPRSVRLAARPNDRDEIHSTALGKAIASDLPREQVREILETEGMERKTSNTVTDIDTYFAELDEVRERGWALDDCENESDGRCVAVPLTGAGMPLAISISAPVDRMQPEQIPGMVARLTRVAEAITNDLADSKAFDEIDEDGATATPDLART